MADGESADGDTVGCCPCGTELPSQRLSCPVCHRLVHAERLKELVAQATRCEGADDLRGALSSLRGALALLPAGSRQHTEVSRRATRLSDLVIDLGPAAPPSSDAGRAPSARAGDPRRKGWPLVSAIGAFFVFVLTKAKLLLLGLGKASTLFTMLLSLGVYWSLWGGWFALGLVLSIYVHEIGHVSALRAFGIPASAPMFLPGVGALVRMKQYPHTVREDARVGLAGPIWGLGASLAVLAAYAALRLPVLAAVATVGAWINLFNLLPVATLDGGRGFRALSRPQRWLAVLVIAATWALTREGLLVLLGLGAVAQAAGVGAAPPGDRRSLLAYAGLVVCLSAVTLVPVPT